MFPLNLNILGSLITPEKGFSLIAKHLSDSLKIKVKKFDLNFDAINKKVTYTVYSEQIENGKFTAPFEKGEKYIDVAMHYLHGYIPEGCEIHSAVVNYNEGEKSVGYLFFEQDGKKQHVSHEF